MKGTGLMVNKAGPLSLLQDLGRTGHFRQGLTTGGPADRLSFQWANRLCGNRANTTALEITVGGVELEATGSCQVAIAGADGEVFINGVSVDNWCSHNLQPGDHLSIPPLRRGLRIYLAVRGGFLVEPAFGSTATVMREKIGGLSGESLKSGDFLPVVTCRDEPCFRLPPVKRPALPGGESLRLIPGWQYSSFPKRLRRDFFNTTFYVSRDSDRMGIRLQGQPLAGHQQHQVRMISEGIVCGAVQIPPDGVPIIMLNDHQTMGGYPKIGTVISCDLWRLAQLRPGEKIGFQPISSCKAHHIMRRVMREFESTLPEPA